MNPISPDESILVGGWQLQNGRIVPDKVAKRIEDLINHHLIKVNDLDDGWKVIFVDPHDNRYWELNYPQGELHGSGAPVLSCCTNGEISVD